MFNSRRGPFFLLFAFCWMREAGGSGSEGKREEDEVRGKGVEARGWKEAREWKEVEVKKERGRERVRLVFFFFFGKDLHPSPTAPLFSLCRVEQDTSLANLIYFLLPDVSSR